MHSHFKPSVPPDALLFLENRGRVARERREKSGRKQFITVTRQTGAAGPAFFDMLKAKLAEHDAQQQGWMVFEKNLIQKVLEEHHMPFRLARYMDETIDSEINDTLEELFGLHPARWVLVRKTTETMLQVARLGHSIIVGRAANLATKKLTGGLHVQLVAPLATRVRRIQDFYRLDAEKALAFVKEEDREKKAYMKKYFGHDINDPTIYDLVLNTEILCYEDCVSAILGVIHNSDLSANQGA